MDINNTGRYAIFDLEDHHYPQLASTLKEVVRRQIEVMLEPAMRSAAATFSRSLFDYDPQGKYDSQFTRILHEAVVEAVTTSGYQFTDEELSRRESSRQRMQTAIESMEARARVVRGLLSNIQMTGNPRDIAEVMSFLDWAAISLQGEAFGA